MLFACVFTPKCVFLNIQSPLHFSILPVAFTDAVLPRGFDIEQRRWALIAQQRPRACDLSCARMRTTHGVTLGEKTCIPNADGVRANIAWNLTGDFAHSLASWGRGAPISQQQGCEADEHEPNCSVHATAANARAMLAFM
jgi:hypothetical protein